MTTDQNFQKLKDNEEKIAEKTNNIKDLRKNLSAHLKS